MHFQLIKTPTLDFPNLKDLLKLKHIFFLFRWQWVIYKVQNVVL